MHCCLAFFFLFPKFLFQFQIICAAQLPTQSVFSTVQHDLAIWIPNVSTYDYFTAPQQSLMHRRKRAEQAQTGLPYSNSGAQMKMEDTILIMHEQGSFHFLFSCPVQHPTSKNKTNWKKKSWSTRASLQGTCVQSWLGFTENSQTQKT